MPSPTAIDPLIAYRLRWLEDRARVLARREGELFDQLCRVREEREATERIIRVLDPPAPTSRHVLFVDGASRGHPRMAACGFVLEGPTSDASKEGAKLLGPLSCNAAEFAAAIVGLEAALAAGISRLEVRSDSTVVVGAMRDESQIRAPHLLRLFEQAVDLVGRFETVEFTHIPREQNRRADALASAALAQLDRRAA